MNVLTLSALLTTLFLEEVLLISSETSEAVVSTLGFHKLNELICAFCVAKERPFKQTDTIIAANIMSISLRNRQVDFKNV